MNLWKRFTKAIAVTAALAVTLPSLSVSAAWQRDGISWRFLENNNPRTGWIQTNEKWYFLDSEGIMETGWVLTGGKWYYMNPDGSMATGWKKIDGKWYFLQANGDMATGWVKSGDKWYYTDSVNGDMKFGRVEVNGKTYILGDENDGAMKTGFIEEAGKTYFAADTGEIISGVVQINGITYYFDEEADGAMATGRVRIDGKTYRFGEDGECQSYRKPAAGIAFSIKGTDGAVIPVQPTDNTTTSSGSIQDWITGGDVDSDIPEEPLIVAPLPEEPYIPPIEEKYTAIYLTEDGEGDGSTPETPTNLAGAIAASHQGSVLVVIGTVTLTGTLPSCGHTLRFTSAYGETDYRQSEAKLVIQNAVTLSDPTEFSFIRLEAVAGKAVAGSPKDVSIIACGGNKTRIGKGTTCLKGEGVTDYPYLFGGHNIVNAQSPDCLSTDLTVESGEWASVRGGHRRKNGGEATARTINGDISLTITGGRFWSDVAAGSQSSMEGNACLTIEGGEFMAPVYGIWKFGTNSFNGLNNGNVSVRITSGTFHKPLIAVWKAARDPKDPDIYLNGTVRVYLNGGSFEEGIVGSAGISGRNTAILKYNQQVFSPSDLNVTGFDTIQGCDGDPGKVYHIRITPKELMKQKGDIAQFAAFSNLDGEMQWSVDSELSAIDQNGLLTISSEELSPILTVTVSMKEDSEIFDTAIVSLPGAGEYQGLPAVYVKDGGLGNGSAPDSPLSDLNQAASLLTSGGYLVICGPTTLSNQLDTPETEEELIITSLADSDYRETAGATLNVGAYMSFHGPVTMQNLDLLVKKSSQLILCNGNRTILGEGITCIRSGASNFIGVTGGSNITSEDDAAACQEISPDLTIKSGDWQVIRGGHRRSKFTAETACTINGNITLNIEGGTFHDVITGGGQNNQIGNIDVCITGGNIKKALHGLCNYGSKGPSKFEGIVSITAEGGVFAGQITASSLSSEKVTTQLDGEFRVTLNGGDFLKTTKIQGADPSVTMGTNTSVITVSEEVKESYEKDFISFQNPIMAGADPSITLYNGKYYLMKSGSTPSADGSYNNYCLYLYEADTIAGLASAESHIVWAPDSKDPAQAAYSKELWSPKLYNLDGDWYIYVSCDDGDNANHRVYVLKADDQANPCGSYTFLGRLEGPELENHWAIGPHIADLPTGENGALARYYFFTGRDEGNTEQYLYATRMESPTSLATSPVKICEPTYPWEYSDGGPNLPRVVEGATPLISPDGNIYILYSGNGSWGDNYCLGMMKLTENGDPLEPNDWEKYPEPVLKTYIDEENPQNTVYAPGHAAFLHWDDADGNRQDWIVFHGQLTKGGGWNGRSIFAQPFTWNDKGEPVFGHPDLVTEYRFPITPKQIVNIIKQFDTINLPE